MGMRAPGPESVVSAGEGAVGGSLTASGTPLAAAGDAAERAPGAGRPPRAPRSSGLENPGRAGPVLRRPAPCPGGGAVGQASRGCGSAGVAPAGAGRGRWGREDT